MNETTSEVQVAKQYEPKKIEKIKQSTLNTDITAPVCAFLTTLSGVNTLKNNLCANNITFCCF